MTIRRNGISIVFVKIGDGDGKDDIIHFRNQQLRVVDILNMLLWVFKDGKQIIARIFSIWRGWKYKRIYIFFGE